MMVSPLFERQFIFVLAVNAGKIHKQKESATFRCIKVPTAGD